MTWLNKSATKELWKYQIDTNSSFRFQSKVDTFSTMWRLSQERSGFDEAIYWIELLLKLGNFDHLKINDHHLNLIQYFCVDVFIFYFLLCLAFLYFIFTMCIRLQRKLDLKTKIKYDWLNKTHRSSNTNIYLSLETDVPPSTFFNELNETVYFPQKGTFHKNKLLSKYLRRISTRKTLPISIYSRLTTVSL